MKNLKFLNNLFHYFFWGHSTIDMFTKLPAIGSKRNASILVGAQVISGSLQLCDNSSFCP